MSTSGSPNPEQLDLGLRPDQDDAIRRAAATLGVTCSEFVAASALDRAHELLAEQREFLLDAGAWEAFVRLLDQPPPSSAPLVELFTRPSRVEH